MPSPELKAIHRKWLKRRLQQALGEQGIVQSVGSDPDDQTRIEATLEFRQEQPRQRGRILLPRA